MLMQLNAVGEQLGSAQDAPVRTQELQAPNAKLLPSEHELHETAAQLKAAELDITSQQQLLSTLLRSVSEGVVIVDCNGHVLMENEAAIRIVGYSARLVGAKRWCEAIGAYPVDGDRPLPPEDMPTMRACRGEEVRGVELVLHGVADDRNILIEVRSSPLLGVDGKIVGAIADFNDFTERRMPLRLKPGSLLWSARPARPLSRGIAAARWSIGTMEPRGCSAIPPTKWWGATSPCFLWPAIAGNRAAA